MKHFIIIPVLIFVSFYSPAFTQNTRKFDTTFSNTSSAKYFQNNPSINKIEFYTTKSKVNFLEIFPKTVWHAKGFDNYTNQKNYEYYNLGFLGDIYLLDKKYGIIDLPEKEIAVLSKKTCGLYYYINGFINPDSIRLKLSYTCISEPIDPEEKIFEKVEIGIRYSGGIIILKQQLEDAIKTKNITLTNKIEDSILIFTVLLDGKDSSLKRIELIEGTYSAFSQTMINALIKSGPWLPPLQGGRPVKAYFKIFIRLHKDNSLTTAIPEY